MNNNTNIHLKLKFLVIAMAILIVAALILLAVLIIIKKKNKYHLEAPQVSPNFGKTINLLNMGIPDTCTPLEIIYKENYIAIYSKKCNIIKIFNIR